MKFGKRLTAIVLSLAMVFVSAPLSFAADQGWTVTFDSSAYGEGTLSVELYEARRGYAPDIKWTRGAGSLKADKTGAQLFGSGDYYAVVQYEAGSSGDPANLSDAQIEAEFDKYWIAMYGSLPDGQGSGSGGAPSGYPYWGRDDALEWYDEILEDEDFMAWLEDEGWYLPLPSSEELIEYAEGNVYYDPDDPDFDPDAVQEEIDEEILYEVNEIAEAYIEYSGGSYGADYSNLYYQYDIDAKRNTIMGCIAYPDYYIQMGYTPPGAGGGDAFVKSVVHLLSSSEKANGLTVGSSFFDACRPLEITPMQVGEKTDHQTYQQVPLYAENAVWRVFGDVAVPAAIRAREQQEESDSVDPISEGLIGNLYGRDTASAALTGLVDTDVPLYVEPGSYLVTAASSASEDTDEPYSVFDWENVTVTNSGGSVSFAGNRPYATLNINGSVLNAAPSVMSLKVVLSGGDLKSAEVEAELMSYGFDTSTYEYSQTVSPIKVKPGTYGDAMVTCSSSNIDMVGGVMAGEVVFVCSFWEKNGIGTLASGSNTNWSIPKLSKTETNFTASLEFTGANGEEAPFGEGTAVDGRMVLDAGEWKLASAVVMKQEVESMEQYNPLFFDDITVLATRAEYANGILITRAAGDEHTWFSLTAPEESSVVNARSYLNVDGIVDLEFTAAALLDTGVGSGETVELGSAEFSAAAGTLANGYLTLTDSNTGSLRFTYTPEAGQERPASVSVKLVYLDTAGERRNVSAALSGPQTFTGTVDIPEDAAVLESAVFSAPSGNLLTKNLQAIIVLAHASASLNTSGYALAPEFDALKVIYGRKIYAMPKAGGVFAGLCPRGAYRRTPSGDGMAVFFIENEPFTVGGSLEDFCTGADTFALDTSTLPDKIRVDVLGDFREDEIDASGKFVLADKTVNAYTSSNYFDSEGYHFYLERPVSASAAGNIELTAETRGYSYVLTSDVGEAVGNGISYTAPFVRGASLSIETDMKVRWLTDYMYMDVFCGPDGTTPAQQDLSFDFYGADGSWVGFGSWYWRTKQLETSFLDSSSRYRLSFNSYGSVEEPFELEETWIRPVHNGENENNAPVVVLHEKAAVIIDALFYSDNEGIPGSGTGAVNLGVDYDVFYKNKSTGEWTTLPGRIIHGSQMTGHLDLGLGSYFLSDAVDMSLIDKDSGLKLVFGEKANLADMVNFIGGSYHRLGQEVRLVSGQEFYTNPAQGNNGGITTQYITGNETILYPDNIEYYSDYAYTWEFGERAVHGDLESGIIRGLELAQIPRIDLRADRNITPQPITFALRGADGSFRRFDYNTATMDSGSVDQFTLRDLPYGNYELLTVFNRDAYGEQLISQFADGMDVVVPVTMCASVTNVSFTERDAYAGVQLPPPPVDASVPGIQSMTVTSSAEVAMAGDRLQFTVKFACVPGADQEGRTLSFNSDGSRFTIDGASLSLTDAEGRRVSGYELDNDHIVVPENAGILTGSLIVTGRAVGSDSAYATLLTVAGTTENSRAPRFRTRCSIQTFKAQIPDTIRDGQANLNGRGTAGAVLTVKAVSQTDPSRSATTNIEVGRYGYWTGDVTYPVDGARPDTFTVTIKDSEGRLLAEGETAYEADQVLPEKIVITTYMNGAKNITTGYPGSKKDFESLNNAVLQFGPDYTHVPIEVELTFSDTDPDAYGMTDARRVHDPELTLKLPNYNDGGGLCYAFYPVDTLTYHYHNDDLDLDIPNAVYSTKWLASFPAFHFGRFAVSYELFDGEGDTDLPALDDHTDFSKYVMNSLGLTSAAAQQYRNALVETGNWINGYEGGEYAHTGHYEAEVLWSDPGIQIKDLDSSVVKAGADPEMYLLKPVEDVSAEFTVDASMSWKALDSGEYEDAVAELTRKQPGYSQSYSSANSFIKYIDRSAEYSIVYNNSADSESRGTFDLKISTSYTAIIDSGVLGDGSLMDDGDFISRGYIISENVDSTVLGLTAEHAGGVVDDVLELREGASTILSKTYAKVGLNDLAAQEANIAKWSSRLSTASTVIGAATNALSFGMTVRTELTGENKAIIDLNRMAADYNRRMQDYCDKLLAKITCFDRKNHNQRVSSEIANIKDSALNEIAAIQAKFKDIYEMNGYIEIAVSATSFIPCPPSVPGAAAVLQFLEKEARESNEAFNAFLQMKEMEQAAQKYENKMYEAFRGYDPSLCDQVPPIQPITREVKTVEVEIEPKRILDPSGVVYEGSLSYPLEGVTVTIEYLDNGVWKQWDEAPLYNDQKPSYTTDQTGFYRWDVPDGRWRVKYYKEGYNGGEPVVSGEMDVPPIWLDVNQELSSAEPAEGTAAADSGGVTLTFSKPVRAEDITSGKVVLLNGASPVEAPVITLSDQDGELVRTVYIAAALEKGMAYSVQVTGVRTYAGTASSFTADVDLSDLSTVAKVTANVSDGSTVGYGSYLELTSPTAGAEIWYTTNGVCPKDDAENRVKYEGPIQLTESAYYFRIRALKDGVWSAGLPLHITVVPTDKPIMRFSGVSYGSNSITLAAELENYTGSDINGRVCTAVYYKGRMIASELSSAVVADQGYNRVSQTVRWTESVSDRQDLSVRIFFIDAATFKPLCEASTVK